MDINDLRSFSQVARSGSLSQAAVQLNVAQPTLSRQIQKLEDELGVQLLVRRARGVELTQAGSVLLSQVGDLIERLTRTLALVRGHEQTFTGHAAVGVAPTSGLLIAPEIFRIFKKNWPDATLLIREGVSSSLEEWLLERRIDLAVLHNPVPLDGIEMIPILHEQMNLVTASGSEFQRSGVRFRDLEEIPLIPSKPASWKPEIAGESRHSLQCPPEHHAGGRQRPASEEDGDAWLWRHRPDLRWSFPGGWSRRACGLSDRAPACDLDDLHRHATRCSIVLAYDGACPDPARLHRPIGCDGRLGSCQNGGRRARALTCARPPSEAATAARRSQPQERAVRRRLGRYGRRDIRRRNGQYE